MIRRALMVCAVLSTPACAWAEPLGGDPMPVGEVEQVVWRGVPVRLDLRLGVERIVELSGAHQVKAGLLGGPVPGLRVQILGNRVYLLAKRPFASTRMLLRSEDGRSALLDLAADEKFPAGRTLAILAPQNAKAKAPVIEAAPLPKKRVGYVALVRHAAQSLYAPERLIPRSTEIVRAPLHASGTVPLVRGGSVEALPVASWRASGPNGPLWVTACRLRNLSQEPAILDPRDLRGEWLAAAFQHARLAPRGDPADTTTAYLISSSDFRAAMEPWLRSSSSAIPRNQEARVAGATEGASR